MRNGELVVERDGTWTSDPAVLKVLVLQKMLRWPNDLLIKLLEWSFCHLQPISSRQLLCMFDYEVMNIHCFYKIRKIKRPTKVNTHIPTDLYLGQGLRFSDFCDNHSELRDHPHLASLPGV